MHTAVVVVVVVVVVIVLRRIQGVGLEVDSAPLPLTPAHVDSFVVIVRAGETASSSIISGNAVPTRGDKWGHELVGVSFVAGVVIGVSGVVVVVVLCCGVEPEPCQALH